jgi:hypothetical protein
MRPLLLLSSLLSLSLLLSGCADMGCDAVAYSGVGVSVTDRATGQPITTATVTLRDGDYVEVLTENESYTGAWERPGDYEITVDAPGYQTVVLEDVVVEQGDCHVVSVQKSVAMGYAS